MPNGTSIKGSVVQSGRQRDGAKVNLVVQDNTQQGIVDVDLAVVLGAGFATRFGACRKKLLV